MRKFLVTGLSVLIAVAIISCTGQVGPTGPKGDKGNQGDPGANFDQIPANATVLINENFDSYAIGVTPTGWTRQWAWANGTNIYHSVSNTPYVSYEKSFKIITGESYFDRQIIKAPLATLPSTTSGKIYMSFYVRKPVANDDAKGFVFYVNQLEKLRVDFDDAGAINFYTSKTAFTQLGTYNANEWYKVNILLNLTTSTYSVYIRDYIVENIPCYNSVECTMYNTPIETQYTIYPTFWGIMTGLNLFYSGNSAYIDNVVIYYLP